MAATRRDFPANTEAEKLVADYLGAVIRAASGWQQSYPGEDIEHLFVQALYRAAWTYRPGKAGFFCWFLRKARGSLSGANRRARQRRLGLPPMGRPRTGGIPVRRGPPITILQLSTEQFDRRFYYRQRTEDEEEDEDTPNFAQRDQPHLPTISPETTASL